MSEPNSYETITFYMSDEVAEADLNRLFREQVKRDGGLFWEDEDGTLGGFVPIAVEDDD